MSQSFRFLSTLPVLAMGLLSLPSFGAPPLVDATGVQKSVVSTLVIPAGGLSEKSVRTIIESHDLGDVGSASTIPPGYKEVSVPMGPHMAVDPYGPSYYAGLGYPTVALADPNNPCQGNVTSPPRIVQGGGETVCQGGETQTCFTNPVTNFICEPVGVRYSLLKIVGGQTLNVSRPMLDLKTIYPAIGMSNQAATAYCQSMSYTNYTPGSVVTTQPGSCDQKITRWNGSIFYNDDACYNNVMQSLQCFK